MRGVGSDAETGVIPDAETGDKPDAETGDGAVAQLGERLVRNEEVRGSIPLSSTTISGSIAQCHGALKRWPEILQSTIRQRLLQASNDVCG